MAATERHRTISASGQGRHAHHHRGERGRGHRAALRGPAAGRQALAGHTVRYQAAGSTFARSADRHRWLVDMGGTPARTADGARLGAADVVVQYVTVRPSLYRDRWGSTSPYTETVGSGSALVLRNGRRHGVGWSRRTAESGTSFTTRDSKQMTYASGRVRIVFAPK
ncbi:DUF3048 C-terminal domain-containing protein [Streptomyces sp. NPDC056930]|uniref:DUF3048 C-terminal domain-containing protein n=1 Tax=Streptomyces sp. NPDC056930 TaxID=3345967 RepID=UPI00363B88C4